MLSTPEMPGLFPMELCQRQWFRPTLSPRCELSMDRASTVAGLHRLNARIINQVKDLPNVLTYDPLPVLCPATARSCASHRGGQRIFSDEDHLTQAGAGLLSDDFLRFLEQQAVP